MLLSRLSLAMVFAGGILAADAPAPVPLSETVAALSLPEGFRATLFAGEPDVVQPIAMATDARGRLWVMECLSYPNWTTNKTGRDRVIILEDKDGDGRFDEKTVFYDKGRNLSGIALGFGGVWLCSLPELIFIPDADGDDRPDGEPQALLDGWFMGSQHNVFNNLNWGPDGWLYGCNGILATSLVGAPGTSKEKRVPMNCGVWRFHPTRQVFEVVAHGTTNPWGIAFNEAGQMFVANCVIKHLFHIIPGARYERMFGQDFDPYAFQLIPSIADHIHWAGGFWKTEGADHPQNDLAGGGHAHSGAMVYLGGAWPEKYRGRFFTINIHGHRVNQDVLERRGSGYVAKHAEDLLRVNDTWFRGVSVIPTPDGSIYVSDWSDAGECHDYDDIHRDNGRIYKISHGNSPLPQFDTRRLSDLDLVRNLAARNEWLATQSRLILQERGTDVSAEARLNLWNLRTLRSVWTLHALGELTDDRVNTLLRDRDEYIRAWTVQLALESGGENRSLISELSRMAESESSPVVRLYLASALQRVPPAARLRIASGLVVHGEDSDDPNLPLMIWFGIESMVAENETAALRLLTVAEIPLVRRFITQRLVLGQKLDALSGFLASAINAHTQRDVAHGMFDALNGRRQVPLPAHWPEAAARLEKHSDPRVREEALRLSLIFGDSGALEEFKSRVIDKAADTTARVSALEGLIQTRQPDVLPLLQTALKEPALRHGAIRGLAAFDDPKTPGFVLDSYAALAPEEKAEAINTLASRASFALALLEGVQRGAVPVRDITPFSARQIQAYKDPRLEQLLRDLGSVRTVSGEKKAQIAQYKTLLQPAALERANPSRGREVFQRACAACHTLFGEGGTLAPELTGSQRANIDYVLENVVDPNAVVWDRYKASYFETSDDRLISGAIINENESTVTIQTQTGVIALPVSEITSRRASSLSMMPEGLLEALGDREIIDLIAYLQSPIQVPLPKE
jgi:putative membrane-bound dehydrogenase-like protein